MADELKLYRASNNQVLSGPGTFTNAVELTLRADLEETDSVRLYAMTDAGYEATGVEVELQGDTAAKWELAPDDNGSAGEYEDPGAPLVLGAVGAGSEGRVYFWARASVAEEEAIQNDDTVLLVAEGIGAVASEE